ncbi:protein ALP1-like [Senna tora]|uniref:Protein ALP1-like n=1 Tax=Senna tora TaxID=362788 RepID=A0A834WZY5_9FABA|nr:protein ALP1-like [Senna tora]
MVVGGSPVVVGGAVGCSSSSSTSSDGGEVMDEVTTETIGEIIVCMVTLMVALHNCLMHEALTIGVHRNRLPSRSYTLDFHEKRAHLRNLVYSNDSNCYNVLRMYRATFDRLCSMLDEIGGLKPTKHMLVDEQVAMCLNVLAHHAKNRIIQWNFGRSGSTISKYFKAVLKAIIRLHRVLYKTPNPVPEDSTDPRWKWFKNFLGALDGTHKRIRVHKDDQTRFRNRKGDLTINDLLEIDMPKLCGCDFNACAIFDEGEDSTPLFIWFMHFGLQPEALSLDACRFRNIDGSSAGRFRASSIMQLLLCSFLITLFKRPRTTAEKRKNKMGSSSSSEVIDGLFSNMDQKNNYLTNFAQRSVAQSSHTVCNYLLPEPQEHIPDTTNFAASNFDFSNRVLHYIVQGCITNKQGNHSYASASEQFIMYCINTQDPFNLPHFILEKMQRIARSTGLALSYASLISLILEKQGVDPLLGDGNDEKPDVIDESTLYNMRFEPYQGRWYAKQMTKGQKKAHAQKEKAAGALKAREEETELDGGEGGSSSQPPIQNHSELLRAIQALQVTTESGFAAVNTRMDTGFAALNTRIDGFSSHLAGIDTTVQGINNRMEAIDTTMDGFDIRLKAMEELRDRKLNRSGRTRISGELNRRENGEEEGEMQEIKNNGGDKRGVEEIGNLQVQKIGTRTATLQPLSPATHSDDDLQRRRWLCFFDDNPTATARRFNTFII